jgi:NACalpha-BTF3-like transcription factor
MKIPTIEARTNRINMVKSLIINLEEVEYKRLAAIVSENTGVRFEKAKEYVKQLIDSGFCYTENGVVKLKK